MRVLVDALPINNFSGRHVIAGHLRELRALTGDAHEIVVLRHEGNADLEARLPHAEFRVAQGIGGGWAPRLAWQVLHMQRVLEEEGAELLLSTSGALVPRVRTPQIVFAMNPWCFFPEFHAGVRDRVKAAAQRIGYARAQRGARAVCFLSEYISRAYREEAGGRARTERLVYVGVDEDRYRDRPATFAERRPAVLTVSVMARHKAIEDVVRAFAMIAPEAPDSELRLAGPWSDAEYRSEIEHLAAELGVAERVRVLGELSDAELAEEYGCNRVFCLLSRCESFGIPAVEAQASGTPTVVANVCAPPEVAGPGGVVTPPGDLEAASRSLLQLLCDPAAWDARAEAARTNAERFRWPVVAREFASLLEEIA